MCPKNSWFDANGGRYYIVIDQFDWTHLGKDYSGRFIAVRHAETHTVASKLWIGSSHLTWAYRGMGYGDPHQEERWRELEDTLVEATKQALYYGRLPEREEIWLGGRGDSVLGVFMETDELEDGNHRPRFRFTKNASYEREWTRTLQTELLGALEADYRTGVELTKLLQDTHLDPTLISRELKLLVKNHLVSLSTEARGGQPVQICRITDEGLARLEEAREQNMPGRNREGTRSEGAYDCFICHAGADKKDFVDELAARLKQHCKVWYAGFELKIGDSLAGKIDEGLTKSRRGVVVLSRNFFGLRRRWPRKELNALVSKAQERAVLPVWHRITHDEIATHSALLADIFAVESSEGMDVVVRKLLDSMEIAVEPGRGGADSAASSKVKTPLRVSINGTTVGSCQEQLEGCLSLAGENVVTIVHTVPDGKQLNVCKNCLRTRLSSGDWVKGSWPVLREIRGHGDKGTQYLR